MKKSVDYRGLLGETNPLLRYPQIYEAAMDEFSQKKFEDASLNDILKTANISKGSFYHHFGDKFGLYLSMMDLVIKKKIEYFLPILQENQYNDDFFQTIKLVVRGTMAFMHVDERFHHLFNRNMEVEAAFRRKLMEFFPYDFSQDFGPMIDRAIQSGQIDSRYSVQFIAKFLEIVFSNAHKLLATDDYADEIVEMIDQMINLMQFGISAKKGGMQG